MKDGAYCNLSLNTYRAFCHIERHIKTHRLPVADIIDRFLQFL
jgi:hypothetical protein